MVKNMDLNELLQANIIELEKIAADNGIDLKKNATKIDILLKILPSRKSQGLFLSYIAYSIVYIGIQ